MRPPPRSPVWNLAVILRACQLVTVFIVDARGVFVHMYIVDQSVSMRNQKRQNQPSGSKCSLKLDFEAPVKKIAPFRLGSIRLKRRFWERTSEIAHYVIRVGQKHRPGPRLSFLAIAGELREICDTSERLIPCVTACSPTRQDTEQQVAQRHQEVSGTIALL